MGSALPTFGQSITTILYNENKIKAIESYRNLVQPVSVSAVAGLTES